MKEIYYFMGKLHKFAGNVLYLNLAGMMFIGLLDGFSMLLLVPLLSIIGVIEVPLGSIPGMNMLSFLKEMPIASALLLILGIYVCLVALQTLVSRNLSLRDIRIHTGFINHIRLEIYRSLLEAQWTFFVRKRKTELINSLTGELGRVTSGTYMFLQLIASAAFTAIQIAIALWISAELTLFVLGCGLVVSFFSRRFIKKSKELGSVSVELAKEYMTGITDHFNGMKDIKSNQLEKSRYRWLKNWSSQIQTERYESSRVRSNSQLFYKLTSAVLIAVFLFATIMIFQTKGAELLMITIIFSRLWPRFTGIQSSIEQIASTLPAFNGLVTLLEDSKAAKELAFQMDRSDQMTSLALSSGLTFKGISFRYDQSQTQYTLQDIHMEIPVNGMTAIVGRSGAGKSTLVDLLLGLVKAEKGEILIDGKPIKDDDMMSLRRSISYVPQDAFLYHASIRDNLLTIDPTMDEGRLWEALTFASAAEFVRKLPDGIDTIIGDRGVLLSGGERQRIVLARAILRQPSILILDEATSALDAVNEAQIQEALFKLKGQMTIIVIAHRMTTVRDANEIFVLENGRIVQQGTYDELSEETNGLFRSLLGNQKPVAS